MSEKDRGERRDKIEWRKRERRGREITKSQEITNYWRKEGRSSRLVLGRPRKIRIREDSEKGWRERKEEPK